MAQNSDQLFDIYHDLVDDVYRYTRFKLGNREEAEDATAETFLRLFSQRELKEVQDTKAYTIGIARNVIYEIYREKYKVEELSDSDYPEAELIDDGKLETKAIDESLTTLVREELDTLDPLTSEIIILRIWEEWKFSEIADSLKLKETTVKLRFYRGIEQLKKNLNQTKPNLTIPVLLGSILAVSSSTEYALPVNFIQKVNKLLTSQLPISPMEPQTIIPQTNPTSITPVSAAGNAGIKSTALLTPKVVAGAMVGIALGGAAVIAAVNANRPEVQNPPATNTSTSSTVVNSANSTSSDSAQTATETSNSISQPTQTAATSLDIEWTTCDRHVNGVEIWRAVCPASWTVQGVGELGLQAYGNYKDQDYWVTFSPQDTTGYQQPDEATTDIDSWVAQDLNSLGLTPEDVTIEDRSREAVLVRRVTNAPITINGANNLFHAYYLMKATNPKAFQVTITGNKDTGNRKHMEDILDYMFDRITVPSTIF